MKIGILTGTRPDIIKMAPLFHKAKEMNHEPVLIHTSQHYPFHLYEGVYRDLEMDFPAHFEVGMSMVKKAAVKASKAAHHADRKNPNLKATKRLESVATKLFDSRPNPAQTVSTMMSNLNKLFRTGLKDLDILLTHGDTLTCMSGSLSAALNLIPVGHVEAGLRTFSKEPFPEQIDTRTSDACADLYFAATEENKANLLNEGFPKQRISVVGNTVVDAALWAAEKGKKQSTIFEDLNIDKNSKIVYFSAHRRENLMHEHRFKAITESAIELANQGYTVLWSIRPGTRVALQQYNLGKKIENIENLLPVSDIPNYSDLMYLLSKSWMTVTDSGSMQEEISALKIPCATLRFNTDRPESVKAGLNRIAPPKSKESILEVVKTIDRDNKEMRKSKNPYGDGTSSEKIIRKIEEFEGKLIEWEHQKQTQKGNKVFP
ncbi:MAG: UDP-N-acetylglucosamine 2-epimerase (non-hydrolyzing) [Candidatus Diapherotrites archaeon]|nr:UDP-N-acetylglucosamine 2-epimerase (non-hydrolyzing) [Candidatus Diapherotrites archaeon]